MRLAFRPTPSTIPRAGEGDYIAVQLDMCALHIARHDGVWRVIEDVEMKAYG